MNLTNLIFMQKSTEEHKPEHSDRKERNHQAE